MKKSILIISSLVFILTASSSSFAQGNSQDKGKGKQVKEQKQTPAQGKGQNKAQDDKGNQGKKDNPPSISQNPNANNQGKGNNGQGNSNKDKKVVFNNSDDGDNSGNGKKIIFNRENFPDRKKFKNQDKVTICHKFNRGDEQPVTIRVSSNAAQAHMNHGDVMGDCPASVVGDRKGFSEGFWKIRNRYYNTLYENQDQVIYSRSILDYALQRLSDARVQLVQYQSDPALYQRRQALVVDLERNTSLLETLIGTAAGYLASKLVD
jgi:hypothetical protein